MKYISRILIVLVLNALVGSCSVNKDYQAALKVHSIYAYESYLKEHPKSKHVPEVKRLLVGMYEDRTWRLAKSIHNLDSYQGYLADYPDGRYAQLARLAIAEIKEKKRLDEAWSKAKSENTVPAYQFFLESFPSSTHTSEAKSRIVQLLDNQDWEAASLKNTISAYDEYIRKNPSGAHVRDARIIIASIAEQTVVLPKWNEARRLNTRQAYERFLSMYPNSSYADDAVDALERFEAADWRTALGLNSIKGYTAYLQKNPTGEHADIAQKKIIDLEVDKIFRGDHGQLPQMSRDGYSSSYSLTNTVEITNNTAYRLTLRYSGIESRKIVLNPRQQKSITLKNGSYRVAASVDAANVRNYAGVENLSGGSYSTEYYIRSESYRGW